jgi:adenine phosphoribosyltransferase
MSSYDYDAHIASIPDYPEKGVIFKDITPLFDDPAGIAAMTEDIAAAFAGKGVEKIVGAEARGFMVGVPVAYKMDCGFVPARKPGKLPRAVYSQSYSLEYGTDALEVHKDAFEPGEKVLVVDDLAATGGSAIATAKLVEKCGAEVVGFAFILELAFLNPREAIAKEYPGVEFFSLTQVN